MKKLILGIKGQVVCVDKQTGEREWATKVKSTSGVTNVYLDGKDVFAYSGGHLYCLDVHSGAIKWQNDLPGLGFGPCIMASADQLAANVSNQVAAQQASAAAIASATVINGQNTGT